MRKIILALVLFFILSWPALSQEPIKIFLPLILKAKVSEMPAIVERWKVISPVESTNYVLNPSAETTGNYSALAGATTTRVTTYQKYGMYSYRVQTGSNGQGISLILSTLPNENCFATARIRGKLPVGIRFIIGSGLKTPLLIEKVDTQWSLYGVEFNAAECSGQTELHIVQVGNGTGDFYVDGIQVENLEYWTTYIDGDQEGCYWNGSAHMTTSTRSGKSRAGGQVKDLYQDYGFLVDKVIGAGSATKDLGVDEYAFLPGGELNNIKIHPREWSLIGRFIADSEGQIFQNRQDLIKLLRKNPQKESTKFLFYHLKGIREIKAFFAGGLEGDQSVFYDSWVTEDDDKWAQLNKYTEKAAIQLRSPDPYFYGQGDKSIALDVNDSATFRLVAARLKSTGKWSNLGPPNAAGTYTIVRGIAEDDTYIYFSGLFTNFDNIANADYIVRYNKQTGVYSALGTGLNDRAFALAIAPNGDLYVGGFFTSAGGVANTAKIARWDGSAWNSVGGGLSDVVHALVFGPDGKLYIGGVFTNAGGDANADYLATWNGIAFASVGIPNTGAAAITQVSCLAFDHKGNLYIGGPFLNWANIAEADNIVMWNGTAYSALGTGLDSTVNGLAVDSGDILYLVGGFTNFVESWNGSAFSTLGSGINNTGRSVAVAPDNSVYVSGDFTSAGGIILADKIARWNGYAWSHLDIDLPGGASAYAIHPSKYVDPIIPQKYDLWLGFDTLGTGYFADKITATNEGSVDVSPKFVFKRDGGTTITLETIKNESTGRELLFDYNLLDGEQLTVDLTPTKKSIISSYFGNRLDAVLANSDFGTFALEVGSNDITVFAADDFALYPSSFEAFMIWKETYESYD